jgi:hypothetical protein
MLALLYDIHGNLPALEAVLGDARERGADRWLLGGDMAPFGAWPAETVARLRELPAATWIRGNTERWLVERLPADEPMAAAVEACREPAVRDGIELLNPGSVGIPLDGDHRAAYALLAPDGSVELRRVEYGWRASAQALRDRYGDAEWVAIVTGRIERARLSPD